MHEVQVCEVRILVNKQNIIFVTSPRCNRTSDNGIRLKGEIEGESLVGRADSWQVNSLCKEE